MRWAWILWVAALPTASQAAPADYRFEAVTPTLQRGVGVPFQVRAVSRFNGQPVPGIEIRDAYVDRSPDGQRGGSLPAFFTPSLAYGVYNFRADLPVDGNWALTFQAKVPGEPQLIAGTVTFSVVGRLPAVASPTAGPR
jgi:hypothetical protein